MTSAQVQAEVGPGRSSAVVPFGAVTKHGPHQPLYTIGGGSGCLRMLPAPARPSRPLRGSHGGHGVLAGRPCAIRARGVAAPLIGLGGGDDALSLGIVTVVWMTVPSRHPAGLMRDATMLARHRRCGGG
jgi:hypothetical protein